MKLRDTSPSPGTERGLGSTILAVAHDAGGANALVPIVRELSRRKEVRVRVLACAEASGVFRRERIGHPPMDLCEPIPSSESEAIRHTFLKVAPQALLLGTGGGLSLDKVLLKIANDCGVPSVSVVDHWCNYRERFVEPSSGQWCLPSRITLMDRWALDDAVKAGLPRRILTVEGQPHLDALAVRLKDPRLRQKGQALRRQWMGRPGTDRGRKLLLFASESFSRDSHLGPAYYHGFTERDVLEDLVQAVDLLESWEPLSVQVVVKLHPRESSDTFPMGKRAQQRSVRVVSEHPWSCLLASDGVVGVASMLLLEACLAQRPAISYRPSGCDGWIFHGSRMGLVPSVSSVQRLAETLRRVLRDSTRRPGIGRNGNSTALNRLARGDSAYRIADIVLELAGRASHKRKVERR